MSPTPRFETWRIRLFSPVRSSLRREVKWHFRNRNIASYEKGHLLYGFLHALLLSISPQLPRFSPTKGNLCRDHTRLASSRIWVRRSNSRNFRQISNCFIEIARSRLSIIEHRFEGGLQFDGNTFTYRNDTLDDQYVGSPTSNIDKAWGSLLRGKNKKLP